MAVRRSTKIKTEPEVSEPMGWEEPKKHEKSTWEIMGPIMVAVMVVMSFALGGMWNKIKMLEAGGSTGTGSNNAAAAAPAGKYATFKAAAMDYAKQIGLDTKTFESCVSSGSKAAAITADTTEGTNLGVQGTPGFFINGRFVGGAFPYDNFKEVIDKELAGQGSSNVSAYSQAMQDAAKNYQAFNPVPKDVPIGNAPVQGPADAKVTIVEYSDFQCPYCEAVYQTFKQVAQNYAGKYKLVYKEFPLTSIHPNAQKAAEVALCANDQGKFWQMHDALFDNQKDWSSLPSGWN